MQCMDSHLCVCVCLYVGHTFCQLTYRSDPPTEFTADSLKDAGLRKNVPFSGHKI